MSENASLFNCKGHDDPLPGDRPVTPPETPDRWIATVPRAAPVLIAGPTASGKSALALALARAQGRQIVNADALQVYARWRILTARPTPDEEAAVPHRLYGHVGRDEAWSTGHWLRAVAGILAEDPAPVIVGGTGLYFTALTSGLAEIPPVPPAVRAVADAMPLGALVADLDPETAARIDLANRARVQRAWEVLRATGRGLAAWQAETGPPVLPAARAVRVVLDPPRDWLAARIDARFDAMLAAGALDEVARELPHWDPVQPSARAIGAPELVAHLEGRMSLAEAATAAKAASRQYAKRQRTWFRNRMGDWPRLDPMGPQ
jgi:tRNA dimethylallyltransferase